MLIAIILLVLVAVIRLVGGKQAGKEAFGVVKTFFIIVFAIIVCILLYLTIGGVRG